MEDSLRYPLHGVLRVLCAGGFLFATAWQARAGQTYAEWLEKDQHGASEWLQREHGARSPATSRCPADTPQQLSSSTNAFLSVPPGWISAGSRYTYEPEVCESYAADTFNLAESPDGMIVDEASGRLSWLPTLDHAGSNAVSLVVSRGGVSTSQVFNIFVAHAVDRHQLEFGRDGGSVMSGRCRASVPAGTTTNTCKMSLGRLTRLPDLQTRDGVIPLSAGYVMRLQGSETGTVPATLAINYDVPRGLPEDVDRTPRMFVYSPHLVPNVREIPTLKSRGADTLAAVLEIHRQTPKLIAFLAYRQPWQYTRFGDSEYAPTFFKTSELRTRNRAEVAAYCKQISSAVEAAAEDARKQGFLTPRTAPIYIYSRDNQDGIYDYIVGSLEINSNLEPGSPRHLSTGPHEFFHAVQDQYYNMVTSSWIKESFIWWMESSATWFEQRYDSNKIGKRISKLYRGLFRTPLGCDAPKTAYAQAAFIEYAQTVQPTFVRDLLGSSGNVLGLLEAVNNVMPLSHHYPRYIEWAATRYWSDIAKYIDHEVELGADGKGRRWSYSSQAERLSMVQEWQAIELKSGLSDVFTLTLRQKKLEPYTAFVAEVHPRRLVGDSTSPSAVRWPYPDTRATVKLTGLEHNPYDSFVLGRRWNDPYKRILTVAPDCDPVGIPGFGYGDDDFSSILLVSAYAPMRGSGRVPNLSPTWSVKVLQSICRDVHVSASFASDSTSPGLESIAIAVADISVSGKRCSTKGPEATFEGLPAGKYLVTASCPGYATAKKQIEIVRPPSTTQTPLEPIDVSLTLQSASMGSSYRVFRGTSDVLVHATSPWGGGKELRTTAMCDVELRVVSRVEDGKPLYAGFLLLKQPHGRIFFTDRGELVVRQDLDVSRQAVSKTAWCYMKDSALVLNADIKRVAIRPVDKEWRLQVNGKIDDKGKAVVSIDWLYFNESDWKETVLYEHLVKSQVVLHEVPEHDGFPFWNPPSLRD